VQLPAGIRITAIRHLTFGTRIPVAEGHRKNSDTLVSLPHVSLPLKLERLDGIQWIQGAGSPLPSQLWISRHEFRQAVVPCTDPVHPVDSACRSTQKDGIHGIHGIVFYPRPESLSSGRGGQPGSRWRGTSNDGILNRAFSRTQAVAEAGLTCGPVPRRIATVKPT
jgi:hypothetical protein